MALHTAESEKPVLPDMLSGEKGSGKVLVLRADMDALSMEDLLDKSYRSVNFG